MIDDPLALVAFLCCCMPTAFGIGALIVKIACDWVGLG